MAHENELDAWVGHRLKDLRSERGITLVTLSEQTGISVTHLSRLEKGHRQPSIGSLLQIARVYGISVSELIQEQEPEDYHLVRADDAVEHPGQDGQYTVLSGPGSTIAVIRVEVEPGKSTKDAKHAGEEWLHVLSGEVFFRLEGKDITLSSGDSLHFDSSKVHRLTNKSEKPATVLVASTAATMPMHHPVPSPKSRR
ncbi:cupin domain-containing protein [Streptomyces umbrinus]|uniref:cupin domain-containing protein n=1 Tax=Streptomyces umbrinus TaxID=67370 RepID=UPI0016780356|nr:cupin domain-containing protein [Streptomyces umbrinus]MCR3724906.1 quercetin dioxygenase-like cupin family protein [Streptomyces umbrinus]MCX4563914.1 cupin domain-containing protein [Streptomyces phaeochromogenes]GHH61084.1 DNA-binding protein [Streptomyces umbrinus]